MVSFSKELLFDRVSNPSIVEPFLFRRLLDDQKAVFDVGGRFT
jgi:hypothetical protein